LDLVIFGDKGWPPTGILLISAFQIARITGMSHWCSWVRIILPLRGPFSFKVQGRAE
jgi:hypothetical protein